jgi:hypothetical protein
MISKDRYNYSISVGNKAENKFKDLMISRGNTCIESTREQNIYNHIDFFVNDIPVDVKGARHLETIWLEKKNVHGNKGWLEGDSKYIVFDVEELNSFCIYKTKDLLDYISNIKDVAESKKDYLKLYTRQGRKDILVKVKYKHIKHLEIQKINYNYGR